MIEVKNLCKNYGTHRAVENLSFTIEPGHVYGFLGPNGAGKSTTMNILTGCLAASSGEVSIGGFDIFEDAKEAKSLIGYLPEQPPLYQEMTVLEYLKFVAAAKGVAKEARSEHLATITELTQLNDVADRMIKNLSKGYKQRVGIAQALTGNPEIIILDEPTVGLDPKQIIEIRELIRQLGREHTVILSSHILSEVRSVCDRLLVIAKGKLVANDTPEALEAKYAPMSFEEIFLELTGEMSEEQAQAIADGQLLTSGAASVSAADKEKNDEETTNEGTTAAVHAETSEQDVTDTDDTTCFAVEAGVAADSEQATAVQAEAADTADMADMAQEQKKEVSEGESDISERV